MARTTTSVELDLLMQLLAQGGSCRSVTDLDLSASISAARLSRYGRQLQTQGLITAQEAIAQFGLTVTGKTLLKLDTSVWPVTPDELLILRSCLRGRISPGQIHPRVPGTERLRLLEGLAEQGLIVVYRREIIDLHLTDLGRGYFIEKRPSN